MSTIEMTAKQTQLWQAVQSKKYNYLLFGGGVGGGKTVAGVLILCLLCKIYPKSHWTIMRADLPRLKKSVIPTFEKVAPRPFFGPFNRTDWYVDAANGSRIQILPESLSTDPDLDRLKSYETNGFYLEEANELSEKTFNKCIERAGRWSMPPGKPFPNPMVLASCNPADGWVKKTFYDPWRLGTLQVPYFFLPSLVLDNPHHNAAYLKSLEELKKRDPIAYQRFVEGDWNVSNDPLQLIKSEWIINARTVSPIEGKRGLGVDVARYGDDDTVFCPTIGNQVLPLERHHGLSLDQVADLVQMKIHDGPIDAPRVCIDVCGLGAGPYDELQRKGFRVTGIDSGRKAEGDESDKPIEQRSNTFVFKNRRSQLWWELREKFRLGQLCIANPEPQLIEDLTAVRYNISADRMITVESKDMLKLRIGRSPDAGDALVYACAAPAELGWTTTNRPVAVPRHDNLVINQQTGDSWEKIEEEEEVPSYYRRAGHGVGGIL